MIPRPSHDPLDQLVAVLVEPLFLVLHHLLPLVVVAQPDPQRRQRGEVTRSLGGRTDGRTDGQERWVRRFTKEKTAGGEVTDIALAWMFFRPAPSPSASSSSTRTIFDLCTHSQIHNTHARTADSIVSLSGPSLLSRRLQDPLSLRPDQLLLQILKTTPMQFTTSGRGQG